jgi:HK97 gp10 family phage protein
MRITLLGLDRLRAELARLPGELGAAAEAGHQELGDRAVSQIRADAPRGTGRLAGTIRTRRVNEFVYEVVVGEEGVTPYLGFNEFGTHRQPARPFVRPAAGRAESSHEATMLAQARRRIR